MKTWHIIALIVLGLAVVYAFLRMSAPAATPAAATTAPGRPQAPPASSPSWTSRLSGIFGATATSGGSVISTGISTARKPLSYVPGSSNSTVRTIASGGVSLGLGAIGINFP